ncbi:MAG: pyrroline-5-carboxylate reductase, partial [Coriobacteriia bacterium]|nr:pyrroline-5-carboxylate reductase [Coriobacteriia bacterium]
MSVPYTLAIIGGGRMGEAIAAGLTSTGAVDAAALAVAEPAESRKAVFDRLGVRTVADGSDIVSGAELVLLAVKPQVIDSVVSQLAGSLTAGTVVVSIASGVPTVRLESMLPPGTAVVRVMPNAPAMVGSGMAVVSAGSNATLEQAERVRALFEVLGDALVIEESAQDAATAISGSGPAYVAVFVDALAEAGVAEGLTREEAQRLAIRTFAGTAEMLRATGMQPQELVDA